jgi:hypothetical protein
VTEFLAARSFRRAIVIDLPPDYSHALLKFPKLDSIRDELPSECAFYATDLSMKRNIGLILARMLQWQRVFFLDDDIRDIAYPDLQATVDMLGSFPTAGMWVTEFPDNSIVCHANRTTGRPQDVFVSGAALAVDSTQDISFFPDIYNEDWLFFFDNVASKRLANSGLKATQLTYYPFANPRRAAWQEFGDVLAEGLYALLHLGGNVEHATPQYWSVFLEARRNFLEGILTRSQNADEQVRDEMAESVSAALKSLLHIKPEVCARYVQSWRWDLAHWKRRMAGVPAMPSVGQALAELGLAPTKPASTWKVMPHWDDPQPTVTAGPASIPQFDTLNRMRGNAEGLRDRLAVSEERQPTLPLPVVTDEPHGRHRASRHNIASLYHKLRTAGRPAHRATPTDRPAPATPESVILVNSNPGSLRTAEELAPRLTDTHALHSRHLMSHCYSVVFADGERQAPAPLCRRYRAPAR